MNFRQGTKYINQIIKTMEKLNLSQLIELNEGLEPNQSFLFELMAPYKKSLYTYFKDLFCCEPVVMVTSITNATQYIKIVPSNEFMEAIQEYVSTMDLNLEDEANEIELINFNSKMLKDIL